MQSYRKYIKQGLAILLFLFVICTFVPYTYATEGTKSSEASKENSGNEISELESQRKETIDEINSLKDSISNVQEEIDSLKTEKNTLQSYINQLDKKIDTLTKEIGAFEEKIEEKTEDIEETKAELEEAKIACEDQYESMKKRIQFIYENPTASLLEMLCTSSSLAEVLDRADYVFYMSDYEQQMMDKLVATKEEIALKEKTLEEELEELKMMQAELETQKKEVDTTINEKKGELDSKAAQIGNASNEQSDYEKQLEEQEKLLDEIEEQIARAAKPDTYQGSATGFIWPCPAYTRISSYFGPRPQPVPGASTDHKGVDLAAPYGSDILASAAGVVTTSQYSSSAGNYIVIAHGNGISTVYMHASSLLVSVGETVEQGQVIAKVGSTGYSSGNHLHFGVIKNGTYVDPLGYISP